MTLSLRDISKTFADGTRAVKPASLTMQSGEILSLLGPSGCGKTTLLRVIAGLESADPGGHVAFDGADVTHLPVERRQIGMVFQSYGLFPNMSVRGNLGYGLKMQRMPRAEAEARVAEVLALCRLEEHADRAVTALSGGQKQRVALARAVAPQPRILLLDEPLSALDASLRDALRDELARLLRTIGTTAIFVTHDQTEALAIADRIAVMREGVIEQTGSPTELYRAPASQFVARFVGHAMPLGGRRDGPALHLPGGTLPVPDTPGEAFVRAEDVRIDPQGPLAARVETRTFLGTHHQLLLSGAADQPIRALHHGPEAPSPGSAVRLSITRDAVLMLPADRS